jgi:FtsP/CotA-like multicopper oxidase with cupredoxin domain
MMVSRRGALAGAGGLLVCPRLVLAETAADGFQVIRARAQQAALLESGPATAQWGFGEKGAPAVLSARQGEEAKFRFINDLDHDIWLHWFGVRGPSELMTLNVPPGEAAAVDCVFTPPDAGSFWLGPMADISRSRALGLYAMLVVAEKDSLPGLVDLPLILSDWKIGDDGVIDPAFGDMAVAVAEGRLGNWFTINGRYRPSLRLAAGAYTRLRLLNAANARSMRLQFKGDDPLLVALDGQPLALPRQLGGEGLSLDPGQRADLLVQGAEGGTRLALDLFEDVVELGSLASGGGAAPQLAENFALPANPLPAGFDPATAQRVDLLLEGGEKGGLAGARLNGEMKDLRALLEAGFGWAINGVAGLGGPPLGPFAKGLPVLLAVDNRTAFDQPLHLHGHVWQLVEANGAAVADAPWRDTAVIAGRGSAKLLFVADNAGVWAIQSLVAERADAGLVVGFEVG